MPRDVQLQVADHPSLRAAAFVTTFAAPLGELETPASVLALLDADAAAAGGERARGRARRAAQRSAAQRTKTHGGTRATLSVILGCAGFVERLREAERWYRALLGETGAETAGAAAERGDA